MKVTSEKFFRLNRARGDSNPVRSGCQPNTLSSRPSRLSHSLSFLSLFTHSRTLRSYQNIHAFHQHSQNPTLPLPQKKEPRVDLQERAILPSIRGLHMYYSIALFTERPKAKRPTSTEHLIHFNVPSKHIYHIHTRARVNQPPPLLLLLAVLIDRTEVVIIVKPI